MTRLHVTGGGQLQWLVRAATAAAILHAGAAAGQAQKPEDHESGAYLYKAFCAACHGEDGKGKGPVADTLPSPVPDLTTLSRAGGGTFPRDRVRRSIETGGPTAAHVPGGMPTWREAFARLEPSKGTADKRIQALVDYVESLQAKERGR
jgi:mono/diheme cytochrome c family protein